MMERATHYCQLSGKLGLRARDTKNKIKILQRLSEGLTWMVGIEPRTLKPLEIGT